MADVAEGRNSRTLAQELNGFVADTYLLLAKTQSFHWNVTGPQFPGLHELFEKQYKELFEAIDELAERVRALEHHAPTGLREMLDRSMIEDNGQVPDATTMCRILHADNKALSERAAELAEMAEDDDDLATADMLLDRVTAHDKAAWMLKSSIG